MIWGFLVLVRALFIRIVGHLSKFKGFIPSIHLHVSVVVSLRVVDSVWVYTIAVLF